MTKPRQHLTSEVQGTYTWTHVPEDLTTREERPAPWMPLDGLAEEWATFGRETLSAEGSLATSHAFAALSEERQALAAYHCREEQPLWEPLAAWVRRCYGYESSLSCLQEAAIQWGHAAFALERAGGSAAQTPGGQQELRTLVAYALQQRLRVSTIATCLLAGQVRLCQGQEADSLE